LQLDKQFAKAEEAFEKLSKDIKHATPEQLFLNQASFIKAVDFSVVELSSKALFSKSLSFIFSHSRLSTNNLICC
jgi:transcription-repair coupling factor (superfamily II helicase)